METATRPDGSKHRVSIAGALAGMVVTFLLGVYVGVHPTWLPIKSSSVSDFSTPLKTPPATQPATTQESRTR
jgi:hypothetical protein